MSAFAKGNLELLIKYFDGIQHCAEHGEEQTEVCAECVRFFCRVCTPEPCPCWQERMMKRMIIPITFTYPEKNEEGKEPGRAMRVIFHHKGKGLGSNPRTGISTPVRCMAHIKNILGLIYHGSLFSKEKEKEIQVV